MESGELFILSDMYNDKMYVLVSKEDIENIYENIYCNYLLILFILSCLSTMICCYKKKDNYHLIDNK